MVRSSTGYWYRQIASYFAINGKILSCLLALHLNTAKLVYKDYPRDQQNMVRIHRWSLYASSITWKIYSWRPVECGLDRRMVFIYKWSLEQV